MTSQHVAIKTGLISLRVREALQNLGSKGIEQTKPRAFVVVHLIDSTESAADKKQNEHLSSFRLWTIDDPAFSQHRGQAFNAGTTEGETAALM